MLIRAWVDTHVSFYGENCVKEALFPVDGNVIYVFIIKKDVGMNVGLPC